MANQPAPEPPEAKIGATHLGGFARAGLKELSEILPAFPESIQPKEEMGLAGNALPQEVFQARHEQEPDHAMEMEM